MGSLLPNTEDTVSQQVSWASRSYDLSMPLSVIVPNLTCRVHVEDQSAGVGPPTVTYDLHFD